MFGLSPQVIESLTHLPAQLDGRFASLERRLSDILVSIDRLHDAVYLSKGIEPPPKEEE